ncbi:hemerythrin domain-containing protein [Streptosporangium sp. NPDC051022]|uniref:hemerythrin domain-containing protein n=1 Tax=Streptosporangium sp. NPDC051022 TaxID=3155752 RepID=UPI0034307BB0
MTPELLRLQIVHRAMRGEVRRLAVLAAELADGRQAVDAVRARAVATFVTEMCTSIHHHHVTENEVLWPVIERSAGVKANLRDLRADHYRLDPLLAETNGQAIVFVLTRDASALTTSLTRLADMLDEHIEKKERLLFPIISKYVSLSDWKRAEGAACRGGGVKADLPSIEEYAGPEEFARLRKLAGPVPTLLFPLLRGGHRRRRRLVFGSLAGV